MFVACFKNQDLHLLVMQNDAYYFALKIMC